MLTIKMWALMALMIGPVLFFLIRHELRQR